MDVGSGKSAPTHAHDIETHQIGERTLDKTERNHVGAHPAQTYDHRTLPDAHELAHGGLSAEYGRTTGGVVNVVTRSGGNSFHGSLPVYYTEESLTRNQDDDRGGDYEEPDYRDLELKLKQLRAWEQSAPTMERMAAFRRTVDMLERKGKLDATE